MFTARYVLGVYMQFGLVLAGIEGRVAEPWEQSNK